MSEAELIAKRKARAREVKRMLKKALTELQRVGFLAGFQITSGGLVKVVRANENKDVKAPSTPTDSDS